MAAHRGTYHAYLVAWHAAAHIADDAPALLAVGRAAAGTHERLRLVRAAMSVHAGTADKLMAHILKYERPIGDFLWQHHHAPQNSE
jgi:hypothetical protein